MDAREKLVELLADLYGCDPAYYDVDAWDVAQHLVDHAVAFQKWISVNDKLPKETGRYLVVKKRIAPDELGGNSTDIVILRFSVDDGFKMPTHIPNWINEKINEEVTHWMPLPKLPRRADNG